MTAESAAAPRPALGELARRATAVIEQNAAKNALPYGSQERNDANRVLLQLIVDFREAASPEAILQLVALAAGGAEDTALLDAMERGRWQAKPDGIDGWIVRGPRTDLGMRMGYPNYGAHRLREALADAARSLTPERPADATS